MFLGICIDKAVSDRLDFPPSLVENTTKVGLEHFQGGDAMMPGLIPDEVVADTLVVDMTGSMIDFNG